uniref:Glutaredoxin-2, mitochondrial n=1 Tax=Magallana gigas TaxID=29159 RepID=A0A8W8MYD2_MAGGI
IESLKEFVMGLSSSRVPATLNHPQAKYVQQAVAQNCVVIFSKTTCPFCVQTKEIFRNLGVPYEAVELNNHPNGQDIQNYLGEVTKAKTVPRVFINGACIGGASDTKTLHKSGRLLELVSKCHNPQIEQVRS